MNAHLLMGIDPGKTGAVAVYNPMEKKLVEVFDMPIIRTSAAIKKTQVDAIELYEKLKKYRGLIVGTVIEAVSSAPGQGVVSMFSFGFSAGVVTGVAATLGGGLHPAKPSVWKMLLGLTSDKKLSIALAIKEFPAHAHLFTRTKDGRAEAALLAKFGERIFIKC